LVKENKLLEVKMGVAWCFSTQEGGDVPVIAVHGKLSNSSACILHALVIVPKVESSYLARLGELKANSVSLQLLRTVTA